MKTKLKIIIPIIVAVIAILIAMFTINFTSKDLDDIGSLITNAQDFLTKNDYDQAIAAFEKAIKLDPKNVDAYRGLAQAYQGKGDIDKAIEALEKGIEATGDQRLKDLLDELLNPDEINAEVTEISSETTSQTIEIEEKKVKMPDFVGLTQEDADKLAKDNELSLKFNEAYSKDIKKGIVISQFVPEGAEVLAGSTIPLTISLGVEMVTVPDIVGLTVEEAESLLKENKLDIKIIEEYSDNVEEGKVISQDVPANNNEEVDSEITVTISKGKHKVWLMNYIENPDTAYGYTESVYTMKYDSENRLIELDGYWDKDYINGKPPLYKTIFSYNGNNITSKYYMYSSESEQFNLESETTYIYQNESLYFEDGGKINLSTISSDLQVTYDNNNNITNIIDSFGRSYSFKYDENGNLTESKDNSYNAVGKYSYQEANYIENGETQTINKLLLKYGTYYLSHLSKVGYF